MLQTGTFEGRAVWYLWNQTTAGENFCEKWNKYPERAAAFFEWHRKVIADVEHLAGAQGLDQVRRLLGDIFGTAPANKAMDSLTERVDIARATNRLSVTKPAGLIVGTAASATPVRANTFIDSIKNSDRPVIVAYIMFTVILSAALGVAWSSGPGRPWRRRAHGSARLVPGLERASVPASSIMCATAPLPESQQQEIMPGRLPISDARRLLTYMRYDSAGRFMIGARGSFGLHEPESYFRWLRATARRIYPQLADAAWEDAWGGRFALTVDHLPHIHQPDHGLFTAIGCNGRGIAMMSQIGGLLADLASGELSSDESPVPVTPLRTIPLHAFRRPALEAVGMWFGLQDRFSFLTPAPTGGR
jgi:hypothetical protein